MKTKANVFLLICLIYGLVSCTASSSVESTGNSDNPTTETPSPGSGTISAMDPSGVTLTGLKVEDVQSVVANGNDGVFAVESAAEGIKLVPKQNIILIAGAIYEIIVKTAKADVTYTIKTEMPTGAIMAFNGATCPEGWSVFEGAKGRTLVGAGSGNTDADGTALTARTVGQAGGREFTTGIPAVSDQSDTNVPSSTVHLGKGMVGANPAKIYSGATPNTTISGEKADSNMMPYAVVLYCQKN